jgi:hypothetical protein
MAFKLVEGRARWRAVTHLTSLLWSEPEPGSWKSVLVERPEEKFGGDRLTSDHLALGCAAQRVYSWIGPWGTGSAVRVSLCWHAVFGSLGARQCFGRMRGMQDYGAS